MTIETALDAHAVIGESATWVASERALYWIDVKAPALHRFCPEHGATRSVALTSDIGGFGLGFGPGRGFGGLKIALCWRSIQPLSSAPQPSPKFGGSWPWQLAIPAGQASRIWK